MTTQPAAVPPGPPPAGPCFCGSRRYWWRVAFRQGNWLCVACHPPPLQQPYITHVVTVVRPTPGKEAPR
jgi:hypothetical protein